MASLPIFAAADAAILTARNLIKPAMRGHLQISSSLMFSELSALSEGSTDLSLHLGSKFTIPEYIESKETLVYIGFAEAKARYIWAQWKSIKHIQSIKQMLECSFLEFALTSIPYFKPRDKQEDWDAEMSNWGIGAELRASILDKAYTDIRLTQSAQYWVNDTMEIRFLSLERLQRDSQRRTQTLATPTTTIIDRGRDPVVTVQPATTSTIPTRLALYKAISKDRVRRNETGKIFMDCLVSDTPSDFGLAGTTLCFTPTLQVAEQYRGYIRRRHSGAAPLILQMSIANSFVKGLPPYILQFGDLWKEIIYTCRHEYYLTGDLKHISRLPLIIAPIARSHDASISSLDSHHYISSIHHILRIEESEAIQYVFQGEAVMNSLGEHGEIVVL